MAEDNTLITAEQGVARIRIAIRITSGLKLLIVGLSLIVLRFNGLEFIHFC